MLPQLNKADRTVWDNPNMNKLVNDVASSNNKVFGMTNFKTNGHQLPMLKNNFVNMTQATIKSVKVNDKSAWTRINQKLSLFGDRDNDKLANVFDCSPYDKKKQGVRHKLGNWLLGKGYKEDAPKQDNVFYQIDNMNGNSNYAPRQNKTQRQAVNAFERHRYFLQNDPLYRRQQMLKNEQLKLKTLQTRQQLDKYRVSPLGHLAKQTEMFNQNLGVQPQSVVIRPTQPHDNIFGEMAKANIRSKIW